MYLTVFEERMAAKLRKSEIYERPRPNTIIFGFLNAESSNKRSLITYTVSL